MIKTLQLLFALFIVFTACNDIKVKTQEKFYFSISPYIDQLVSELEQGETGLKKTAYLNDRKDSSFSESVNWESELSIFKEAEINKSAYRDKFEVDTTVNSDQNIITYKTTDKKIRVKFLRVTKNKSGEISSIEVNLKTDNTLYSSSQNLKLIPGKGFSVEGMQNIAQVSLDWFRLDGVFVE